MIKIGIYGASSQVGSSLALYLKNVPKTEVICFLRSEYSIVFFEINNINYRILNDKNYLEEFKELDCLIDCTYPAGQLYEIAASIKNYTSSILSSLPRKCSFIYCSSIMAFGMPDTSKFVKKFIIPRTTYAYIKRKAEIFIRIAGKINKVPVYIFRLGQVHGFLQSVNESFRAKLSNNKVVVLNGRPGDLVNVLFISTLVSAILKIANKEIVEGSYSLVEKPQWTLEELYNYYKNYYDHQVEVVFSPEKKVKVKQKIKYFLTKLTKNFRPLFESNILIKFPLLYKKVKGMFRIMESKNVSGTNFVNEYIDFNILGQNPGQLINGTSLSIEKIIEMEKYFEVLYLKNIDSFKK